MVYRKFTGNFGDLSEKPYYCSIFPTIAPFAPLLFSLFHCLIPNKAAEINPYKKMTNLKKNGILK